VLRLEEVAVPSVKAERVRIKVHRAR
jgi:hypothetical protein